MTANLDRVVVRLSGVVVDALPLDQPILTIGRAKDTDLTLAHPSISRHHAEIRNADDITTIVDLGSANGIVVTGSHVPAHQPLPLSPDTVVQIGPYTLTFQTPDGPESSATLGDKTVMDLHAELRINIDAEERVGQVEEITGSEFFRRLRADQERLRQRGRHPRTGAMA